MSSDHLDELLEKWPFDPESLCVRLLKGADGRDIIQLRIDLGILQLDTTGRPDGMRPEGYSTLLDWLCKQAISTIGVMLTYAHVAIHGAAHSTIIISNGSMCSTR